MNWDEFLPCIVFTNKFGNAGILQMILPSFEPKFEGKKYPVYCILKF